MAAAEAEVAEAEAEVEAEVAAAEAVVEAEVVAEVAAEEAHRDSLFRSGRRSRPRTTCSRRARQ